MRLFLLCLKGILGLRRNWGLAANFTDMHTALLKLCQKYVMYDKQKDVLGVLIIFLLSEVFQDFN